jgi:hypothetical protein
VLLGALALLTLPASAAAQGTPQPAPTTPATAPAPTVPTGQPAVGRFTLTAERVGSEHAVVAGQRFRVRGVVEPYVAGQKATVRFYRGSHKLLAREVTLLRSSTGKSGYFVVGFSTKHAGRVTIKATHLATPQLGTTVATPEKVEILPTHIRAGQRGASVRLLQRALSRLGYVVGRRGLYDARTARAVHAFRKMTGLARTFTADASVFRKLAAGAGRFKVRYPEHGRHVEGDLSHQVLALIGSSGKVERLYPLSSGKPSTPTVLGHFRVYLKTPGTNSEGMVDSNYFIRGYAIHGYAEVPSYPASHGCLRVPVPDAASIYRWVRIGTPVDVYYR